MYHVLPGVYLEEVAGVLDGDVLHEALPVLRAVLLPQGRAGVRARPQVERHEEDTEVQAETNEPTDKPVMIFNEFFSLNGHLSHRGKDRHQRWILSISQKGRQPKRGALTYYLAKTVLSVSITYLALANVFHFSFSRCEMTPSIMSKCPI